MLITAMNKEKNVEKIHTRIWLEEPEPDNLFATQAAYCHGYDVYGAMLGQASWVEMLYLLFQGEQPSPGQIDLLETLAVALANAGPRDPAVHAAMCGAVGGSPAAACLMAALGVGAGQLSGGREVFLVMEAWQTCGTDLAAWQHQLSTPATAIASIWPTPEHPPGFEPHGVTTTTPVKQTLACLARLSAKEKTITESKAHLPWLENNLTMLEGYAQHPLALSGVAAAAFTDLGFNAAQGEMLHLLLRLPGAAAHALEQRAYGHKKFPFFNIDLQNDPAQKATS